MRLIPVFCVGLLLTALLPFENSLAQVPNDEAYQALQSGDYSKARRLYKDRLKESDSLATLNVVYFAETFLAKGEYEEGLEEINKLTRDDSGQPYILHAKGLFFDKMGRFEEAQKAFFASAELKDDLWRNILALGELLDKTGQTSQAQQVFTYVYQPYKNNGFRNADDLGVAGRAAAAVGEYRDANNAFSTAHKLDPTHIRNLQWWANLFRIKYNDAEAQSTLDEAIALNSNYSPLYTTYARSTRSFGQKEQFAAQALEANPNDVEALAILAGLHILDGLYREAEQLLNTALEINPSDVEVLAHLATVHFLRGEQEEFDKIEERALAINSRAGLFYITLAKNCDLKFRYPDAVRFGEMAVRVDRRNPEAYAQLGTSLLRVGRADEAKRYLNFSFDADPFNLFVGNMLTLIDEFEDFSLLQSDNFSLLIHNDERDVLGPAILEVAEECYAVLNEKYPYKPPSGRILLEAYNDPDDFAVRIAGVPHLGLLGVSFGDVLAINTPKNMDTDSYNWARTLWHELVHSMSIGLAEYKMPRWFAEGLAVYEEQQARPEWGREMELDFLMAFDQGKLLPLNEMDRGFTRPTFPGQILLSYYHASQIVDYIATTYGQDAIVRILEGFAAGNNDRESIEEVTGVTLEVLDRAFRDRIREQQKVLADVIKGMPNPFGEGEGFNPLSDGAPWNQNEFLSELQKGYERLGEGDYKEAEAHFEKTLSIYDRYTDPGNAYQGLAAAYRAQGESRKLAALLERYLSISEHGSNEAVELAKILDSEGEQSKAIYYFERSLDVAPYNRDVQTRLAELYAEEGQHDNAVMARRAVLGLNPVDRADAYYQYALSLYKSNRSMEAKRAVLQSLELAPGFRDAQKLLLTVVEQ